MQSTLAFVRGLVQETDTFIKAVQDLRLKEPTEDLTADDYEKIRKIVRILENGRPTLIKHMSLQCKCGEDGDIESVKKIADDIRTCFDHHGNDFEGSGSGRDSIGYKAKKLKKNVDFHTKTYYEMYQSHHIWIFMNFYHEYNPFYVMETDDGGKKEFVASTESKAKLMIRFGNLALYMMVSS
jgi:hypothetical protein